jgi:hypothetical protein
MVIEKKELVNLIKSYLPQANGVTVDRIADEIKADAESIIHSMVRQAAAQERQQLYIKRLKIS